MSNSIVSQVPKNLLFKYRIPCRRFDKKWTKSLLLDESYRVPSFGKFEVQSEFADLRVGWHETGLFVSLLVTGKKKTPWCRSTQLLESDGLQLWIDTRNTGNIHRATKFCHWFLLLPGGGGSRYNQPVATMLKINRAKEDPPMFNPKSISLASQMKMNDYQISAFVPATSIHGWNPEEHRNVGFSFAVVDREMGWQTMGAGPELPINEDPSLWHTLHLIDA